MNPVCGIEKTSSMAPGASNGQTKQQRSSEEHGDYGSGLAVLLNAAHASEKCAKGNHPRFTDSTDTETETETESEHSPSVVVDVKDGSLTMEAGQKDEYTMLNWLSVVPK